MEALDAPSPRPLPSPTPLLTLRLEPTLVVVADTPVDSAPDPIPATGTPVEAFLLGYRAGGGDLQYEGHLIDVIQCESGWNVDSGGYHLGLAQFDPGTWETAAGISGLWEYTDPFHQGYNVAVWMSMIAPNYGTTAGWPHCWWR